MGKDGNSGRGGSGVGANAYIGGRNYQRRGNLTGGKAGALIKAGSRKDPTGKGRDKEKRDKEADAAAAKTSMTRGNVLTSNAGKIAPGGGISPTLKKAVDIAKERKKKN